MKPIIRLTILLILVLCSQIVFAQPNTTPAGSPNVTTRYLGGLRADSAFQLPILNPANRYSKGIDTTARMFASTTDTLPRYMKKGVVVKAMTQFDSNQVGGYTTPAYVANAVSNAMDTSALVQKADSNLYGSYTTKSYVDGEIQTIVDDTSLRLAQLGYGLLRDDTTLVVDTIPIVNGRRLADTSALKLNKSDTATFLITEAELNSRNYLTTAVNTVSVVSANGFGGSVANPTTTPAITITTTVNGIPKGNGTALVPAVAGTDYVTPTGVTTMTNKRINPRSISRTSVTGTVTIPADSVDNFQITAQVGALLVANPSGTPVQGQVFVLEITPAVSAAAITYAPAIKGTSTAPSVSTVGATTTIVFKYAAIGSGVWQFMWAGVVAN